MRYDNIIELIGVWKTDEAIREIEALRFDDAMRYPLLSLVYDRMGDAEKAKDLADKGIELAKKINDPELMLASFSAKSYSLWRMGKNDEVEKIYSQFMELYNNLDEKIEYDRWYATIQHVRGTVMYESGDYDHAIIALKVAYNIRRDLKYISWQSDSSNNLGLLYYNTGEYNLALEYLMMSVETEVILESKHSLGITYTNIADVHRAVGEYELALKFMNLALETSREQPFIPHYEALFYKNLAKIYRAKGEYETAYKCIQKSLNIELPLDNKYRLIETLYQMILLDLDLGKKEEAELLLRTMTELGPFEKGSALSFFYRIAEASIIKAENRLRSKLKAQEMFEAILKDDPQTYDLYIHTVLNLVELLFLELQSYDNPELMDQVKLIVQQIETIATSQNSTPLKIEALLLKSQVALVELKMNDTFEILNEVKNICQANDFKTLYRKAEVIQKELEEEIDKWNYLSQSNAPLFKRISESNIIEYLRMVGKIIS